MHPRELQEDMEIAGYKLPKGTSVLVDYYTMQRLSKYPFFNTSSIFLFSFLFFSFFSFFSFFLIYLFIFVKTNKSFKKYTYFYWIICLERYSLKRDWLEGEGDLCGMKNKKYWCEGKKKKKEEDRKKKKDRSFSC